MNQKGATTLLTRRSAFWTAAGLLATAAAFPPTARSSAQDTPVSVEVSLAKNTVMEGEPIVLNYKITNFSDGEAWLEFGESRKTWLGLNLVDGVGRSAPALTERRPLNVRYEGPFASEGITLSPRMVSEGSVVVSRRLASPRPGRHALLVNLRLPYAVGPVNDPTLHERAHAGQNPLTKQMRLFLTVIRADAAQVRSVADALKEEITQNGGVLSNDGMMSTDLAIQKLFSMPARYARPSQMALVSDPRLSQRAQQLLFTRLIGIGSTLIVDFLEDAAWTLNVEEARSALCVLHIYNDPALRKRIEKMFADHGQPMTRPVVEFG